MDGGGLTSFFAAVFIVCITFGKKKDKMRKPHTHTSQLLVPNDLKIKVLRQILLQRSDRAKSTYTLRHRYKSTCT